MFKIYLIGFSLSLAATNPIVQRLPIPIQGQTCPAPTCSTCPTQICPNTSRPAPCQTCQNPYQNIFNSPRMLLRRPSNNCPCNKPVTVQSAVAQPINQEVLTQLILRKLLSPLPQAPVPSPPAEVHSETELGTKKSAPNVINNYIIIPPDFFNANATKVRVHDRTRTGKRKRKQNRQRNKETGDVKCSCDDKDELDHGDENIDGKHGSLPCPCDKDISTNSMALGEIQNGNIKNTSQVKTDTSKEEIIPSSIDTIVNNIRNSHEEGRKTGYAEPDPVNSDKPKQRHRIGTKNIEEAIIRDFCKRHPTIPEEIAQSLLKNLKKHVESKGTLPYRPYLGKEEPSDHSDYHPPIVYPENEDSEKIQNHRRKSNRGSRRRKPHRSGRRNKKRNEGLKESSDDCDEKCVKAANLAVINIETETITTEKVTATTENKLNEKLTIQDSESQVETPDDFIDKLEQIKERFAELNEIETTTVNYNKHIEPFPELGKEDKLPTVYNNAVDDDDVDYYPDFRSDHVHFHASDEECNIKQEKYHYTTDRNGGPDCNRYVNKELIISNENGENKNSFRDDIGSECSVSIPPNSEESYEESIGDSSEEIHFKPAPRLELPDFKTKHINRFPLELNEQFVADDVETVSSFSDVRAEPKIREIEMKPAKVFTKDKTGRTNVETVYGHSNVVRYGHDGAKSDAIITYYLPEEAMTEDRILLPDDETAIVVAKSIHDLVDRWEDM